MYDSVISAAELVNSHIEKNTNGVIYYVLVRLNKLSEKTTLDFYSYLLNQFTSTATGSVAEINIDQTVERIISDIKMLNKEYRRKAFK